ncbi:MAG: hypothetical protein IT372_09340 [Polyangiaceae bacterium]|nr:hypothetical protein [Polyangiaceae bacterium]
MKKLALLILIAAPPLVLLACGDDSDNNGGGGPVDFVPACERYCEASYAVDCGQTMTVEECKAGCPLLEQQLGGVCVDEYAGVFDCASDLEFTCENGNPIPVASGSTCVSEATSLSECIQTAPCQRYCRAAVEAGCGGSTESACVDACLALRGQYESCDFEYDRLRECQGQGVECDGDTPTSASCATEQQDYDACVAQDI